MLDTYLGFFFLFICRPNSYLGNWRFHSRSRWKNNTQLRGGGAVIWQYVNGAKCAGLVNRLTRLLRKEPLLTTVILHLWTNDMFKSGTCVINKRVRGNLEGIRRLLPNTRMIWSDIIIRLEYAEERIARAGKGNMRNMNKRGSFFFAEVRRW